MSSSYAHLENILNKWAAHEHANEHILNKWAAHDDVHEHPCIRAAHKHAHEKPCIQFLCMYTSKYINQLPIM